ncbi:hypothetical protein D3C72_1534820 [compost metagenome]
MFKRSATRALRSFTLLVPRSDRGGRLLGNLLPVDIHRFTDCVKVPSCNVVQATKIRVGGFIVPVPVLEDTCVCPSANDLADKQIISRLVVWLG